MVDPGKRHIIERQGLNCWGVWEFGDWPSLARQIRASFAHAKQDSTAHPRFVVQRCLLDDFLDCYSTAVAGLRFGHPLAVAAPEDPLPELDFGPLINEARATKLQDTVDGAASEGGTFLHRGALEAGWFTPGQHTACYVPPAAILNPPTSSPLRDTEPLGPVDTITVVDTEERFLAEMNVSDGALAATLSCDDEALARQLSPRLRAFQVGINQPFSRGERRQPFGGTGDSWRGAYIGGDLLVRAVTHGAPGERVEGNFPAAV
jgi:acyl-CoA reductase-like NAD-dependent aldehyde dehydrogenase